MSGLLENSRQCCDAMPSYGLLELGYEIRQLARALAKKVWSVQAGSEADKPQGSYTRARASKSTPAVIGASELSPAGVDPSKAQDWVRHAVHVPEYQIILGLEPQQ